MKILVINHGSSNTKCSLFDFKALSQHPIAPLWETQTNELEPLLEKQKVDIIGHRIVHGGSYFHKSVLITPPVKEKLHHLSTLAPLHSGPELQGIDLMEKLFPGIPQVAVFDTAFHQTMPKAAQIYPTPYSWYEEGIHKYGFHGISAQYCAKQASQLLGSTNLKIVICHLGSGASLTAVKNGKSIDNTMGFTPLDGLMMDTRSGSIDPGILLYLLENKHKSAKELITSLYHESGLLGISGISSDMRDILKEHAKGNTRATLALEIYIHRLNALIGSMIASLGGLDALIFTAGIGENVPLIRERVCDNFSFLGKIKVLVIHTQEAFEIACECYVLGSP